MITYNFENVTGVLYEYIYKCIKNDIISGELKAGEKLPSKRAFAKNNGISTITIQNAYDQLVSEGYIYSIEKKGYFVSDLRDISVLPKESNIKYDIKVPKEEHFEVDFSGNRIAPDNFPFSIWAKLSRDVISNNKDELMTVSHLSGAYELRKAIAKHLKSFRGMLVDPNQIVIGAGTEYLYGILVQLIGNDRTYAIENPGYKKLIDIYGQFNVKTVYANIDCNGLTVEGIESAGGEIAHICPNHHFPTGITMPASRRYEILAWANADDRRYIIEDDYDSEFRHNGKPIPTLFSIDMCEKVIYMNTFSKSLTPTIRVSYMVLPVHLANKMYEKMSFLSCTVSNFEQFTLAKFISQGYFEKHINRMRLYYQRKLNKVKEVISESRLKDCCEVIDNDSGLHFILKIKTDIPDEKLEKILGKEGIRIRFLSDYELIDKTIEQHLLILNYSNIDVAKLKDAFDIICRCIG